MLRILLVLSVALTTSLSAALPEAGLWKGKINIPGSGLPIEVTLSESESGEWSGTIDIPAQNLRGFTLSEVKVSDEGVGFAMQGVPGKPTFFGKLDATGNSIEGDFSQGGQKLTFSLAKAVEGETAAIQAVPEKGIPGEGVTGDWLGVLSVPPVSLRLAVQVSGSASEGFSGSLVSLDQGSTKLDMDSVADSDGVFTFTINRVGGSFTGELSSDGSEIVGEWTQGGHTRPLTFLRVAEQVTLKRPQEPKGPFPYDEREVAFRNEVADISLGGTFVIPEGDGPFRTVIFFTGSGAQDRDESLMEHRPFAVLADALARRGIASLRFDDRGVGKSEGNLMEASVEDLAYDAIAAVRFLEGQREVDQDAIGMIGHSEGGLVGPVASTLEEQLDFLVLLAPPAEALDKLLTRQGSAALRLKGVSEEIIARVEVASALDMTLIKDRSLDREALLAVLEDRKNDFLEDFSETELAAIGYTHELYEQNIKVVTTRWFRELMRVDPAAYLEKLKVPTFALFAEKDFQVDAQVNAEIMRTSLEKAGLIEAKVLVRSGLNHLFQNCETGVLEEYGLIEETFDPATIVMIGDWVLER
ncbi:alpha/beta hydrolase family protein [Pelagicoccus mobilis]